MPTSFYTATGKLYDNIKNRLLYGPGSPAPGPSGPTGPGSAACRDAILNYKAAMQAYLNDGTMENAKLLGQAIKKMGAACKPPPPPPGSCPETKPPSIPVIPPPPPGLIPILGIGIGIGIGCVICPECCVIGVLAAA